MTSKLIFFLIFAPLRAFALGNCDEMPRPGVLKTEVNGSPVILSTVEKIIPLNEKFVIEILRDEAEFEAKRNLIFALNKNSPSCSITKTNPNESFLNGDELDCSKNININDFKGLNNHKICNLNNKKLIFSITFDLNHKDKSNIFKNKNEKTYEEGSFSNTRNLMNF